MKLRDAEEIIQVAALLKDGLGKQTFAGKTREEIDRALAAQIDVIENHLTEGQMLAKYQAGDDFTLGAAVSASGWLRGDDDRPPTVMWPGN